uniref:Uncharacterized protein n=1 Tax=Anguilla anguilla TaxID=7936 RepID=A0A0E9S2Z1_ANGAN
MYNDYNNNIAPLSLSVYINVHKASFYILVRKKI